MPFLLTGHDSKYFHAQGTKGPFKIAKRGLGKGQHEKYLAMCNGGVVPKKMAKGGEVDWATGEGPTQADLSRQATEMGNAAGRTVAGFVAPRANSIGAAAISGIRSALPGGRTYGEEFERYNRDAGAPSVVHPQFRTAEDKMKWAADPENPANVEAMETAMNFALGTAKKGKAAKAQAPAPAAPAAAGAGRQIREFPGLKEARTEAGKIDWRTMPPEEGMAAAREGRYLVRDPKTGDIIGAPPGDKSLEHVAGRVKTLSNAAEAGRPGGDFYDVGHEWMENAAPAGKSGDSWDVVSGYARNQGTQGNLANGITHLNREAVLGPEGPRKDLVRMPEDVTMVDQARAGKIPGQKIEQFTWDNKGSVPESVVPGGQNSRATQDQRMARINGYGDDFSGGLTDFQHLYSNGLTNEALDDLIRRGVPGPLHKGQEVPWNLRRVQAAAWYDQGLKEELRKTVYGGLPFEKLPPELQARARASVEESFPSLSRGFENYISSEAVPAEGSGHRAGMIQASPEVKAKYTQDMSPFDPKTGRDVYAEAVGAHQNPGGIGYGEYQAPSGNFEQNPNYTTRQLVSFTPGKEIAMGAPAGLEHSSQRMADYVAHMKRLFGVQEAVPMHAVKSTGLSGDAGKTATSPGNSYKLSSFKGDPAALSRIAREAGLDVVHRNGEATLLNFSGMDPKSFRTAADGVLKQVGGTAELGNVRSTYGDTSNWAGTPKGEGIQTGKFLKHSEHEPVMSQAASQFQGLRDYFAKILAVDAKSIPGVDMASQPVQTLRGLYAQGGLPAVKDFYVKHGGMGLPAFVPILLQGGVGEQKPEQHSQGGEVQQFADGGIPQALVMPQMMPQMMPPAMAPIPAPGVNPWAASAAGIDPSMVQQAPPAAPAAPAPQPTIGDFEAGVAVPQGEGKGIGDVVMALPNAMQRNYEALQDPSAGPPPGTEGQPAPGGAPYTGAGSLAYGQPQGAVNPTTAPAQDMAPPPPTMPQLGKWGVGAPAAIAAGERQAAAGLEARAKVEQDFFGQMGELQRHAADGAASISAQSQERYRQRTAIADQMERDLLDAKVNPNQFFEQKETGQKILAGIGMLFSGIGAGLTGAPNLAMDVINRAIDRDIDAQKFNIGKKQNYLSYYVKKTGDELTAAHYMKADLLDSVAAQIKAKEFGMQSQSVGPIAEIARGQLKMQAARERQTAAFQELQGQQIQWDQRMKQYQMDMMQRMVGAGPGAGVKGDHTNFLRQGVTAGVFPMDKMAPETVREPIIGPDGKPQVGADGQVQFKPAVTTLRMYNDPERAREAGHIFNTAPTLKAAVQRIQATLRAHPTGTAWLQDPQANAALKTDLAHVYVAYETMVNGLKRQPNDTTVNVIKDATSQPGSITSSILGTSMASMDTVIKQTDAMLQSYREAAWY